MAIDFDGIMLIFGLTALRFAVPLVAMIALCKVLPMCYPHATSTTES